MECGPKMVQFVSMAPNLTSWTGASRPFPVQEEVHCLKYLGSRVTSVGDIDQECRARVNAAWMKRKMAICIMCDKKVPVRMKSKVYRTVVDPVALYGCE
ncbi:hypothetical protein RB195_005541 [Necator americanus]|uniref:Uncharacterized protein n=1 Tax=Necator americanus TaxID=51031 RepID=A0ABR1BND0_NECAM